MANGIHREGRVNKQKERRERLSDVELEIQSFQKPTMPESTPVVAPEVVPIATDVETKPVQRQTKPELKKVPLNRQHYSSIEALKAAIMSDPDVPSEAKESVRFKYEAAQSPIGGTDVGLYSPQEFLDNLDDRMNPLSKYRREYDRLASEFSGYSPRSENAQDLTREEHKAALQQAVGQLEQITSSTSTDTQAEPVVTAEVPGKKVDEGPVHTLTPHEDPEDAKWAGQVRSIPRENLEEDIWRWREKVAKKGGRPPVAAYISHKIDDIKEKTARNIDSLDKKIVDLKAGLPQEGSVDSRLTLEGSGAETEEAREARQKALFERVAARNIELDKQADARDPKIGKFIRSVGERYNTFGTGKKILIGVGLGAGAAIFSGVSTPLAGVCMGGIYAQRLFGGVGMFVKIEKKLQEAAKSDNWFIRRSGGGNIINSRLISSDRYRVIQSALLATIYVLGTGLLAREAVHLVSESSYGEAVQDWLRHHWPFGASGVTPNDVVSSEASTLPPFQEGLATEQLKIPDISVEASRGHGYEYMTKRLWEQLHSQNLNPADYPADSDIHKLLTTQGDSIDKVVHQIASDPQHGFFNPDGTSVRIDLKSHMNFGPDGQIHISDPAHPDIIHAPEHAPTTPQYPPEAPVAHTEVSQGNYVAATPLDSSGHPITATGTTINDAPALDITHPQPESIVHNIDTNVGHESIVNTHSLEVVTSEPHIYADEDGKHLLAYGGSPAERAHFIGEYLKEPAHANHIVYSSDNSNLDSRIPWRSINGEVLPGEPVRTGGFLGFFKSFMKPPEPDEFRKIIK